MAHATAARNHRGALRTTLCYCVSSDREEMRRSLSRILRKSGRVRPGLRRFLGISPSMFCLCNFFARRSEGSSLRAIFCLDLGAPAGQFIRPNTFEISFRSWCSFAAQKACYGQIFIDVRPMDREAIIEPFK